MDEMRGCLFKRIMDPIVRAVILLITGIVVGYLLLVAVFLLPEEQMQNNLSKSMDVLLKEKEYHRVIPGYISTQLDNYTDSWMLGIAVYDNTLPVWRRVLTCTSADYGEGPLDGLVHYLDKPGGGITRWSMPGIGMDILLY